MSKAPDISIDTIRRQIGELAAMQASTHEMEKTIMERATKLLAQAEARIKAARARASVDDVAASDYQEAIAERGRLLQVIAQARVHLN